MHNEDNDLNHDGELSKDEADIGLKKRVIQRRITIGSFLALLVMTGYLFFFADLTRLEALDTIIDIAFITFGGIVASYFGVEGWIKRK